MTNLPAAVPLHARIAFFEHVKSNRPECRSALESFGASIRLAPESFRDRAILAFAEAYTIPIDAPLLPDKTPYARRVAKEKAEGMLRRVTGWADHHGIEAPIPTRNASAYGQHADDVLIAQLASFASEHGFGRDIMSDPPEPTEASIATHKARKAREEAAAHEATRAMLRSGGMDIDEATGTVIVLNAAETTITEPTTDIRPGPEGVVSHPAKPPDTVAETELSPRFGTFDPAIETAVSRDSTISVPAIPAPVSRDNLPAIRTPISRDSALFSDTTETPPEPVENKAISTVPDTTEAALEATKTAPEVVVGDPSNPPDSHLSSEAATSADASTEDGKSGTAAETTETNAVKTTTRKRRAATKARKARRSSSLPLTTPHPSEDLRREHVEHLGMIRHAHLHTGKVLNVSITHNFESLRVYRRFMTDKSLGSKDTRRQLAQEAAIKAVSQHRRDMRKAGFDMSHAGVFEMIPGAALHSHELTHFARTDDVREYLPHIAALYDLDGLDLDRLLTSRDYADEMWKLRRIPFDVQGANHQSFLTFTSAGLKDATDTGFGLSYFGKSASGRLKATVGPDHRKTRVENLRNAASDIERKLIRPYQQQSLTFPVKSRIFTSADLTRPALDRLDILPEDAGWLCDPERRRRDAILWARPAPTPHRTSSSSYIPPSDPSAPHETAPSQHVEMAISP